jgi:SET domain-containing protein
MKMDKKEFLSSLKSTYTRLGVSKNGVGVFAIRDIPKGTDPFRACDPFGGVLRISERELEASDAPKEAKMLVKDFCALQEGYYFVPNYGIDAIDKSYYLNHSKTPNMKAVRGGAEFVSSRKIRKGEELTADYDSYTDAMHFKRK